MSNPTELPDLLPCPFCGGACDPEGWLGSGIGGASVRGPECENCGATTDTIEDWNRRGQPEGEAPQADDVAEVVAVWLRYGQAVIEFTGNPPSVGDKFHRAPAATLSPLCGAQHAESGKEAAGLPIEELWEIHGALRAAGKVDLSHKIALEVRRRQGAAGRAALAAQQAAAPGALELLKADELAALRRFDETCQDGEGYDVRKTMMQRLAAIGVVRRTSGSYYQTTDFGMRVLAHPARSAPGTPEAPKGGA